MRGSLTFCIAQVPGALHALESLGGALEDHLQLLLPALVRLICSGKPFTTAAAWSTYVTC